MSDACAACNAWCCKSAEFRVFTEDHKRWCSLHGIPVLNRDGEMWRTSTSLASCWTRRTGAASTTTAQMRVGIGVVGCETLHGLRVLYAVGACSICDSAHLLNALGLGASMRWRDLRTGRR